MVELNLKITDKGPDLEIVGSDLAIDYGLVSTIHAMLFTDAREDETQLERGENPRGYWADAPGERWGSKLWRLERAKRIPATLTLARQYAQEALARLVAEGIASSVTTEAEFGADRQTLLLRVTVTRSTDERWSDVWKAAEDTTITNGPTTLHVLFR